MTAHWQMAAGAPMQRAVVLLAHHAALPSAAAAGEAPLLPPLDGWLAAAGAGERTATPAQLHRLPLPSPAMSLQLLLQQLPFLLLPVLMLPSPLAGAASCGRSLPLGVAAEQRPLLPLPPLPLLACGVQMLLPLLACGELQMLLPLLACGGL